MSENSVKDTLLSRKKITTSIRRHFSKWKERIVELDKRNHRLYVESKKGTSPFSFDLLVCSISRDNYIVNSCQNTDEIQINNSHSLTFTEKNIEVIVKFRNFDHQAYWEDLIFNVSEQFHLCTQYSAALSLLCKFIRDQRKLIIDQLDLDEASKQKGVNQCLNSIEEELAECYQGNIVEGFEAAFNSATQQLQEEKLFLTTNISLSTESTTASKEKESSLSSAISSPPPPTSGWSRLFREPSLYLASALTGPPKIIPSEEFAITENDEDDFAIVDFSRSDYLFKPVDVPITVLTVPTAACTYADLSQGVTTSELKEMTKQLDTFSSLHIRRNITIDERTLQSEHFPVVIAGAEKSIDVGISKTRPIFDVLNQRLPVTDPFASLTALRHTKRIGMRSLLSLPEPPMNVLFMAVGTRGDVSPFLLMARKLQLRGHRVRLATHASYRSLVLANGLEFYPLAGDPQQLSDFMVRSQGCVVPLSAEFLREIPQHLVLLNEIVESCWDACIMPDPLAEGSNQPIAPFCAQAIIANPVAYGHTHCAEALNIPLHLMFPQPWIPTKAFPHPLSCLSYRNHWSADNRLSYQLVDAMVWMTLQVPINLFRAKKLGLPPLPKNRKTAVARDVPFVKMWSPQLVPKPKDWPEHVDIVGTFIDHNRILISDPAENVLKVVRNNSGEELGKINDDHTELRSETQQLVLNFLHSAGPAEGNYSSSKEIHPILFIGFGSMMFDHPADLIRVLIEAVAVACPHAYVIVQSGWTALNQTQFQEICEEAEKKARYIRDTHSSANACTYVNADTSHIFSSPSHSVHGDRHEEATTADGRSEYWTANRNALLIGPCDHNWLFPYISAAIHHGGAGTTASALAAGKPAWILPFFGDQHFWGSMIRRQELGPDPCPVNLVTFSIAVRSITSLLSPQTLLKAKRMGDTVCQEDGANGAVNAFLRHLPVQNMMCQVSLFAGRSDLAELYCPECGFKMSRMVSAVIHAHPDRRVEHNVQPFAEYQYHHSSFIEATTIGAAAAVPKINQQVASGDETGFCMNATEGNENRKQSSKCSNTNNCYTRSGQTVATEKSSSFLHTVNSVVTHIQKQTQEILPASVSLAFKISRNIQKSWRGSNNQRTQTPRLLSASQESTAQDELGITINNAHSKLPLHERNRIVNECEEEGSQGSEEACDGVFYGRERSTSHTLSQNSYSFSGEVDSDIDLDMLFEEVSDYDAPITDIGICAVEEVLGQQRSSQLYSEIEASVELTGQTLEREQSQYHSLLHPAVLALHESLLHAVRERNATDPVSVDEESVSDETTLTNLNSNDSETTITSPFVNMTDSIDKVATVSEIKVVSQTFNISANSGDSQLLEMAFVEARLCRLVMQHIIDISNNINSVKVSSQRPVIFPFYSSSSPPIVNDKESPMNKQ